MSKKPIYLDHAATGWPKHESVYGAIEHQMREVGVSAGRGAYERSLKSGQVLERCRSLAAQVFHSDPTGVWVLFPSGTAALNQALLGILQPGDHIVTTAADHNSVLRPIEWLRSTGMIEATTVSCNTTGHIDPEQIVAAIRPKTRMIAVTHGSNVTGAINDIGGIVKRIRTSPNPDVLVLCDAAQTTGCVPIDIQALDIDLFATPGHKSLGGPLGTGLLYVGPRATEFIRPITLGGTGGRSDSLEMPHELPYQLESGNVNVPAFAGLAESLRLLMLQNIAEIAESNQSRIRRLCERLREQTSATVYSAEQLPIVSLTLPDADPQDVAAILDSSFGIEVRAGFHCAAVIHDYLQTRESGTLRASFSNLTTDYDLDAFISAIREIGSV